MFRKNLKSQCLNFGTKFKQYIINSTLNVKGVILSEGFGRVDKSTYTNQYQLLVNPPTLTTIATLQAIQQNIRFNQILDLQPIVGSIKFSQNTTALSNFKYQV
jgi:hypothetical protein